MYIVKGYPNLFFTSDKHLGHKFMIQGMVDGNGVLLPGAKIPRPMFSSVEEMNETIVSRHNEVVEKGDLVYDLGDRYIKCPMDTAWEYERRLNGQQFALEGNHDQIAVKMYKSPSNPFIWFRQLEELSLGQPYFSDEEKKLIVICHYAMRVWRNSHHGSWQLYGHSHGMLPEGYTCQQCLFEEQPHSLQFDVGVDCWNFYPVSIEEVKARMATKLPAWQAYKEYVKSSFGRVE